MPADAIIAIVIIVAIIFFIGSIFLNALWVWLAAKWLGFKNRSYKNALIVAALWQGITFLISILTVLLNNVQVFLGTIVGLCMGLINFFGVLPLLIKKFYNEIWGKTFAASGIVWGIVIVMTIILYGILIIFAVVFSAALIGGLGSSLGTML